MSALDSAEAAQPIGEGLGVPGSLRGEVGSLAAAEAVPYPSRSLQPTARRLLTPMNQELARSQMLGQQIRAWEVLDSRVLDVLADVPRENFVPPSSRELAFADTEIPLEHGQIMMAPKVEGRLLQALALSPADRVLEIGTGSGYMTACLAQLSDQVLSIDIFPDFLQSTKEKISSLGCRNVTLEEQDGLELRAPGRYDAVAVTGSVPKLDKTLVELLRPGGRLFAIVGREPVMEAQLITHLGEGQFNTESLFETVLPPLVGADTPPPFQF